MAFTTAQINHLNNAMKANQDVSLGTILSPLSAFLSGSHTVIAAEASASSVTITPGTADLTGFIVNVNRSGSTVTVDAKVSTTGSNLIVADGGSTYDVTEDDVIYYLVW